MYFVITFLDLRVGLWGWKGPLSSPDLLHIQENSHEEKGLRVSGIEGGPGGEFVQRSNPDWTPLYQKPIDLAEMLKDCLPNH